MKAAVIYENGGPDALRYEDVPDPDCPEGCVLVEDGEVCALEYNAARRGDDEGAPQAGLTVYERGAGGRLAAARWSIWTLMCPSPRSLDRSRRPAGPAGRAPG